MGPPTPSSSRIWKAVTRLFNEAAARFVGRTAEDVLGKDDADLFDHPSARRVMDQDRLVMDSGQTLTAEEELTAAGVTRTYHATKAPYRDGHGRIVGVVGVSRDVTERKVAEEKLRRSEEHLRAIVDTTPACIKVVAPDGTLLDMNPIGLRMVEADCLEMVKGMCTYDLIAEEFRDAYRAFHERVCRGEKGSLEFEIVGLRGTRHPVESRAAPLRGPDGTLAHLAITHDVTERKRAGEALRQSEELFRTAFEDTNVAMVLTDPEYLFVRINEAFARLFGYSQEQMLGMAMSQVTHPDDLAESLARRVPLEAGEADYFQMEKRYLHKDGSVFWGLANVTAVRDGHGRVALYVGTGPGHHRPQAGGRGEREIRRASESTAPDRQDVDRGGRAGGDRRRGAAAVADSARGRSRRREPVRPGERRGRVARGGGSKARPRRAGRPLFHPVHGRRGRIAAGESRNRSTSTRCRRVAKSMPCSPRASMRTSSCP